MACASQHSGYVSNSRPAIAPDPLLDHLVGGGQQRFRDGEAEGLSGLKVDDQLEFGRLLDGQIRGLCALEDSPNKLSTQLSNSVFKIDAVAHQPPGGGIESSRVYRR